MATLIVIHTLPEYDSRYDMKVGRIISARRATPGERRKYESESF